MHDWKLVISRTENWDKVEGLEIHGDTKIRVDMGFVTGARRSFWRVYKLAKKIIDIERDYQIRARRIESEKNQPEKSSDGGENK